MMSSSYASSSKTSSSKASRRNSQPDLIQYDKTQFDTDPLSRSTGFLESKNFHEEPDSYDAHASSSSAAGPSNYSHTRYLPGQQDFAEKCKSVLGLISGAKSLLEDLRETNNNFYVIQYPFLTKPDIRRPPQRTQSFSEVRNTRPPLKKGFSYTLSDAINPKAQVSQFQQEVKYRLLPPEDTDEFDAQLNVLKLEMKLQDSSTAEILSLEKGSIAQLLNDRISKILKHLESLSARISDKSSKVLVAGDLNAGKSTFVNALLRRNVLPIDQQPCTSLFCEVLDARENRGAEAVHGIKDIQAYDVDNPDTYTDVGFNNLEKVVSENPDGFALLKIYIQDRRLSNESLLHNGVVDIALIDCPGLNSDSLKTMAVFARQEEIDVVVFLVSAENHFTLSANQFLWNASNEKAYLFIVVNKFDEIKNKEKCRRMILDQIKQISPRTYEYHDDLVHFVSANAINVNDNQPQAQRIPEVDYLEESLRTFVLKKRSKSKLAPAEHYLENLLYDIGVLSEFNRDIAENEYEQITKELNDEEPAFTKLQRDGKRAEQEAEQIAEDTCTSIHLNTKQRLERVIQDVYKLSAECEYNGILSIWSYAIRLRDNMLQVIRNELIESELSAKNQTAECVSSIQSMIVQNLSLEPKDVKIEKIFAHRDNTVQIHIDPGDFFDFSYFNVDFGSRVNESLSMIGLSGGALVMFGGRFLGLNNLMSAAWRVSNILGINNMRRLAVPFLALAGVGAITYVAWDTPHAVSRNLARKIHDQLGKSNYADEEALRVANLGQKATRRAIYNLRDCFRRAIDAQEAKRKEQRAKAEHSAQARLHFSSVLSKAEEMSKVLQELGIEVEDGEVLVVR